MKTSRRSLTLQILRFKESRIRLTGAALLLCAMTSAYAADSDSDGLDDAWETKWFGDLSPAATDDFDGDGRDNLGEQAVGSDPFVNDGVPGKLTWERWNVSEGFKDGVLATTADLAGTIAGLGGPSDENGNFSQRFRGLLTAPVTGEYEFYIAGKNEGELWLSSDAVPFQRVCLGRLDLATGYQTFSTSTLPNGGEVSLVAGQKYYLEILNRKSTSGNHISAAWSYIANNIENVAVKPGAVASQSSIYKGRVASRAIDGVTDTKVNLHAETVSEPNSWWKVDLADECLIERVTLYNRWGFFSRLSNFRISVLNAAGTEVAGQNFFEGTGNAGESMSWDLDVPVTGKTVKVSLLGLNNAGNGYLALTEVEVFSIVGGSTVPDVKKWTNWALKSGAVANQSSTYNSSSGAQKAIDGSRRGGWPGGSVTHTVNGAGAWWNLELGADRGIDRVVVYNRTDGTYANRLVDFRIAILDGQGATISSKDFTGSSQQHYTWVLPATATGSAVKISFIDPNKIQVLSLAEVEVIGESIVAARNVQGLHVIPSEFLETYRIPATDLDDDQLPDAWEIAHGIDETTRVDGSGGPFADLDDDLVPLWMEVAQDLDPNLRDSATGHVRFERNNDTAGYYLARFRETDAAYLPAEEISLLEPFPNELTGRLPGSYMQVNVRGYVEAPADGYYTFWLSAQSGAELWISSDATPFYKNRLAIIDPALGTGHGVFHNGSNLWDVYDSQMSEPVWMNAGQKYFFEVNQIGGHIGSPHATIAWASDSGEREVIPAEALSSFALLSSDADDDRLLDSWETQYGLDPNDNGLLDRERQGEFGDFDGDGLSNRDEFQAGTNPALADTDGDGINDSDELRAYGTNPLLADAPSEAITTTVGLSSYSSSSNVWVEVLGSLISDAFRGKIAWNFNVTEAGVYVVQAGTTLVGNVRDHEVLDIAVSIDGDYIGRYSMVYGNDHKALLRAVTPHLTVGMHNVEFFIDNYIGRRTVQIDSMDVRKPFGVDANSDGMVDWIADTLAEIDYVLPHAAGSVTSPACIEGSARLPQSVLIGANNALAGGDLNHWYFDMPLNVDGTATGYTVTYDSGVTDSGTVSWLETNVLDGGEVNVRVGDELRLTAHDGSASGSFDLTIVSHMMFAGEFTGALPVTDATAVDVLAIPIPPLSDLENVTGKLVDHSSNSVQQLSAYHIETVGSITTFQLQGCLPNGNTKVAKIQLEEHAGGVKAFQVYARYKKGNHIGEDFDSYPAVIVTPGVSGYSIESLNFEFSETVSLNGQADQPFAHPFPYSGKASVTGTHGGVTDTIIVNIRNANLPDDISVVQNMIFNLELNDSDADRTLDFSGGAGLRVSPVEEIDFETYKLKLLPELGGRGFGLIARLWQDGPIADIGDVNSIGVSDALQNELQILTKSAAFPEYSVLSTPLVVTNIPDGGYVDIVIFRAGVTFLDGTTSKTFTAEQFATGLIMLEFLFPEGMEGGYCHHVDVYGVNGEYIGRR